MFIQDLKILNPDYSLPQKESLAWLAKAWARQQHLQADEVLKLFQRVGCREEQISKRYFFLPEFNSSGDDWHILTLPENQGHFLRTEFFSKTVDRVFQKIYEDRTAPKNLIHVTCTGYSSPSAAQKIAAHKWRGEAEVLHAYHMGCYAAIPALRIARGLLAADLSKANSVDIVHTELCTLHLDLHAKLLEQMVIQTLFADGIAAYRLTNSEPSSGFKVVDLRERIIPDTEDAMTWITADFGMKMSLSRNIPKYVGDNLKSFLSEWVSERDLSIDYEKAIFAIHPGGPKIIDFAKTALELTEAQIQHSREVLYERGNMSSATLPHIWDKILQAPDIPPETDVISFAFGPGLTVAGAWMKKL
ncbi:MAG: 3-oxoacyl-[acyl-carrier-protein] synthase III C-terminal domain-containing protein [Pseudobdellovibrionaceae bacterium]